MSKRLLLFIFVLINSGLLRAQAPYSLWSELDISYKIAPKLKLYLGEELRLRDNLSNLDRLETSLGVSYKIEKHFKVGAGYTYINYNHPDGYWENRHRFYGEIDGQFKIYRVTMSLKEKVQSTYRSGVDATETRANPKMYIRSKLSAEYNLKKSRFNPYVSAEIYNTINDPQKNEITKIKYTFGTKFRINEKNSLNLFYRYSSEKNDDDVEGANILGITYSIDLNK